MSEPRVDTTRSDAAVRVKWLCDPDETTRLREDLIRANPPGHEVALVAVSDSRHALGAEILPFVAGTYMLTHLAAVISNLICRQRQGGLIIDARSDPIEITRRREMRGVVVIIDGEGSSHTHDVCAANGADLGTLIDRARGGSR